MTSIAREELLRLCKAHGLRVSELMMANEKAWRSEAEIRSGLMRLWQAMRDCVEQGLQHEGTLPGGLNVKRRAAKLHRSLQEMSKAQRDRLDPQWHGVGQPVRPGGE